MTLLSYKAQKEIVLATFLITEIQYVTEATLSDHKPVLTNGLKDKVTYGQKYMAAESTRSMMGDPTQLVYPSGSRNRERWG